jgi:hypothetical protein
MKPSHILFVAVIFALPFLSGCGKEQSHQACVNNEIQTENRMWFWDHQWDALGENRICALCYMDRDASEDRCFYVNNTSFQANRTKDTCRQYACSTEPNLGNDIPSTGTGTTGSLLNAIVGAFADYEADNP